MIRLTRKDSTPADSTKQQFRLFTDDSAFQVERIYNESQNLGANTYPYVNGVIWESNNQAGNTMTIVSNRAGGVSLMT